MCTIAMPNLKANKNQVRQVPAWLCRGLGGKTAMRYVALHVVNSAVLHTGSEQFSRKQNYRR